MLPSRISAIIFSAALPLSLSLCHLAQAAPKGCAVDAMGNWPRMQLSVIDSQGLPVPDADVTGTINVGKSCLDNIDFKYTTDTNGIAFVTIPNQQKAYFSLKVSKKGFVPMSASWRTREVSTRIPSSYTITLEPGTTIGGFIKDPDSKPIQGATVNILLPSSNQDGITYPSIRDYPSITDANGFWHNDVMPAQFDDIWIKLSHPDYVSDSHYGTTAHSTPKELRTLSVVYIMKKGHNLTGRVLDSNDVPIKDARVMQGADRWGSNYPDTRTDANGFYSFSNVNPGQVILTIQANGFSPDLRVIDFDVNTEPQIFKLEPGRTIKGKVVDVNGNPIAGAFVAADTWRNYRSIEWRPKTDKDGRFVWTEAPADEVFFDIGVAGMMSARRKPLKPSDQEYIITLPPELRITGTVTDAATSLPITNFKLIAGLSWNKSEKDKPSHWDSESPRTFSDLDGKYTCAFDYPYPFHYVKIEAEGYRSEISRAFDSNEGSVTCDFKLSKAQYTSITILTPAGTPAAGAQVAIATKSQSLQIKNGFFENGNRAVLFVTDTVGKFSMPPQSEKFLLIVLHDTGYLKIPSEEFGSNTVKTLTPWSTIQGRFFVGTKPAANDKIVLHIQDDNPASYNAHNYIRVWMRNEVTASSDGSFTFERVSSGKAQICRELPTNQDGRTIYVNYDRSTVVSPGQTLNVTIGGKGRPIIGKLIAPTDCNRPVNFKIMQNHASSKFYEPNLPADFNSMTQEQKKEWYKKWQESPVGKAYFEKSRNATHFQIPVNSDGTFRVDDIPAGLYRANFLAYTMKDQYNYDYQNPVANAFIDINVPDMPTGRSDEPLDVGAIKLQRYDASKFKTR